MQGGRYGSEGLEIWGIMFVGVYRFLAQRDLRVGSEV